MFKKPNCPVIAIEEHYWDPELAKHYTGSEAGRGGETDARLYDLGSLRLKEMDEAGIDIQVLSHGAPSTQKLPAEIAAELTAQVNDRLAKVCAANPKRFAAFAALPTIDPKAAADELERAVTKLGFKGAMLHGMTNGEFLDHKKYWPIYERAEKLDVPIYFHPSLPQPDGDGDLLSGLRQGLPAGGAPGLGLHGGDGDAGYPAGAVRRVRHASQSEDHPRPFRRDAAVPGLAHRCRAQAAGAKADELSRHLLQELLRHDQRLLLQSGAACVA